MSIDIKNHSISFVKIFVCIASGIGILYFFNPVKVQIVNETNPSTIKTFLTDSFIATKNDSKGISVKVARLSFKEIKNLFQKRGKRFLNSSSDIMPMRLIIENNTDKAILIRPPVITMTDVNAIQTALAGTVGGVTTAATIGGLLLAGPIGAIAFGVGFGRSTARKNEKINIEINQKVFINPIQITPHGALNKIILVKSSEMGENFSVTIDSCQYPVNIQE